MTDIISVTSTYIAQGIVMNYIRDLKIDPSSRPFSYWKNTSDNAIIRSLILKHTHSQVFPKAPRPGNESYQ